MFSELCARVIDMLDILIRLVFIKRWRYERELINFEIKREKKNDLHRKKYASRKSEMPILLPPRAKE